MPISNGIIGAGIGGNLAGTILSNRSARHIAEDNRAWQESMYKNRYQMSRADLEAAGYNPMLAVTKGQTAGAVPSGGTASQSAPDIANPIINAVSQRNQTINRNKTTDIMNKNSDANIATQGTQQQLNQASAINQMAQAGMYTASAKQLESTINKNNAEIQLLGQKLIELQYANAGKNKLDSKYNQSKVAEAVKYINGIMEPISTGVQIYGNAKHGQAIQQSNQINQNKLNYQRIRYGRR